MSLPTGLVRSIVIRVLDTLGVTTGGVYTPGGGGMQNPATEDLNMADNAIVVGNAGSTIYDDADGGDHVLTLTGLTGLNLTAPYVNLGGSETFLGPMGEDLDMDGFALVGRALDTIAITAGVGSPTALTAAQSGSLVTNTGTTVKAACTLPASPSVGTFYDFLCDDADGLRVVANTSQTITLGDLGASASAGYVETVRQDSAFRLTYTAANVWRGTRIEGTWLIDSTTSAGFAYTPTAWTSWTPTPDTGRWDSDATWAGLYRQVGDVMEVQIRGSVTGSSPPSNPLITNWAGGFSPSTTKNLLSAVGSNGYHIMFRGTATDASQASHGSFSSIVGCWNQAFPGLYFFNAYTVPNVSGSVLAPAVPYDWASGDTIVVTGSYAVD